MKNWIDRLPEWAVTAWCGGIAILAILVVLLWVSGVQAQEETTVVRKSNIETSKTGKNKFSSKVYATRQWDMTGAPLVKFDASTGKIEAKSRYVKFIPDEATGKLEVKRDIGNAGVKEYWTVPDESVSKLTWAVDTNAETVVWDTKKTTLTFLGFGGLRMFDTEKPKAWDASGKSVSITVSYTGGMLTYTIPKNGYKYPITVDPSVVFVDSDDLTGQLQGSSVATYAGARDLTSALTWQTTSLASGQQYGIPTTYVVDRSLLRFDMTSMPQYKSLDSCRVRIVVSSDQSDTDYNLRMCDTQDSLDTTHFNETMYNEIKGWAASGAYTPTYLSDDVVSTVGITNGDTLSFKFNAAGITNISTTVATQFWILSAKDIASTAPTGTEDLQIEDNSPYIQFWYSIKDNYSRTDLYKNNPNTLWRDGKIPIWRRGN